MPTAPPASPAAPAPSPAGGGRLRPWTVLGRLCVRRPGTVLAAVLALSALAGAAAAVGLRIRPGYVDLLDPDSPLQARYLELLDEFGNVEALHVLVEARAPGRAAAFVDRFAAGARELSDDEGRKLAADVLGRVDLDWFLERLPAWLPRRVLEHLAAEPRTADLVAAAEPARLLDAVREALVGLAGDPTLAPAQAQDAARRLAGLLELLARAARGEPATLTAWLRDAAGATGEDGLDRQGRIRLPDGRYLVTIAPADVRNEFATMDRFMRDVRALSEAVVKDLGGGVSVGFTGAPALLVDEMRSSQRDVLRSTLLALLLVSLLFLLSFHSVRHVGFAVLALVAGLGLTFGAALALVGSLNLFSVVFAAVLVGLGIDFGIHVINHHEGLLRAGVPALEAARRTLPEVGPPTAVGALTTSAAFLSTVLSDFRGFSQLGLIAGAGVLLCLATAVTIVPACLALTARREGAAAIRRTAHPWTARLLQVPARRPVLAVVASALLIAVAAAAVGRLRFDHDLLNLQPVGTEAVLLQRGEQARPVATHHAYAIASSVERAADLERRFAALPVVRSARSAASFLPRSGADDTLALEALAEAVAPAAGAPLPSGPADVPAARAALAALRDELVALQDLAFEADRREELAALDLVLAAADELHDALAAPSSATAATGLASLRDDATGLLRRVAARLPELARRPLAPKDLPPALAARFVGRSGRLAVIVEPRDPVWDREDLEGFVAALRAIDPDVTGPPVQILEITATMWRSLQVASLTALAAIALIVGLALKSLRGLLLAVGPLLAGSVLMLGALAWLDIPLNPANIVALPLVLGIGVDHAVHVAHRWIARRDVAAALAGVGHAIVVTSLTTVAGFSGLLIAAHRGVRSLGAVACVGTCAMLFTSLVTLPAVLALLERRTPGRRRPARGA